MEKITFKISILDSFGYPIERYNLEIHNGVSQEKVREALDQVIPKMTRVMKKVEEEEEAYLIQGRNPMEGPSE
ncbi:MAG: hypothetical protein EB127_31645 [Alphaproteobacteria bacterium]|nr:hypothetical protein [Alphaproteobacteria bacterium]